MAYSEISGTDTISVSVPTKFNDNFLRIHELNGAAMTSSFVAWADDATGSPKDIYYCNTSGGSITVTLPNATTGAAATGRVITFVKLHASNNLILDGLDAQTINGATTQTMTAIYDYRSIVSNGTEWFVIANS